MRWIGVFIFFLFVFSIAVHAENDRYIVEPHNPQNNKLIDSSGADATISFWELPFRIKIAYISGIFITLLGLIKIIPVVLSRIKILLENQNRKNILKYVRNNLGCTITEISDQQMINRGSVKYHIHKLESEGKITIKKMGKFSRLFHNSSIFKDFDKVIASHLRNDMNKLLLWTILEKPGVTNQELSEKFQMDKSTIHWYIQKFYNDEIIIFETKGKYKKCFVNPAIETILLRFMSPVQQSISSKG